MYCKMGPPPVLPYSVLAKQVKKMQKAHESEKAKNKMKRRLTRWSVLRMILREKAFQILVSEAERRGKRVEQKHRERFYELIDERCRFLGTEPLATIELIDERPTTTV